MQASSAAGSTRAAHSAAVVDRYDRLDHAERWLTDAFRVLQANPASFSIGIDVEMTRARALVQRARELGLRLTFTSLLIRAAGLALARHPELHQIISGTRRLHPGQVDLSLSVSNEAIAAPLLLLQNVGERRLPDLAQELATRAPALRAQDSKTLADLRRWGWLVPFGFLRRFILRVLHAPLWVKRRLTGALQITVVPTVDLPLPLLASAAVILAMGRVSERVVARGGQAVVREMVTLTCGADHKLWDGLRAGVFLGEVAKIIEGEDLWAELPTEAPPTIAAPTPLATAAPAPAAPSS